MGEAKKLFEELAELTIRLQKLEDKEIDKFMNNPDNKGKGFIIIFADTPIEIQDKRIRIKALVTQTKAVSFGSLTEQELLGFSMKLLETQQQLLTSLSRRKGLIGVEKHKKW